MLRYFHAIHIRLFFTLCMLFLVFCTCCTHVYAVPDDKQPAVSEVSEKWVDLQAKVPAAFKGSVSVLLQQDSTGELYTLTCYPINHYSNSMLLPAGKYTVMQTFTSEDAFLYDTFLDTESFDLQSSIDLVVTVTENPEGKAFLTELQTKPEATKTPADNKLGSDTEHSAADPSAGEEGIDEALPDSQPVPDAETEQSASSSADKDKSSSSAEQSEDSHLSEENAEEDADRPWPQLLKSILSFLVAVTLLAAVFFGVFYAYHRDSD